VHVTGALLTDGIRALVASTIVIAGGLAMGSRPGGGVSGVLLAVAIVIVFSVSLAWMWAAIGLVLRSPTAVSTLSFGVQCPLTFASNVFVNPKTMPGWLHAFVDVNPVSQLTTTVRHLMAGTASGVEVGWILVAAAAISAVFAPVTCGSTARPEQVVTHPDNSYQPPESHITRKGDHMSDPSSSSPSTPSRKAD
jgi:daunorubicin/doxorubicin transport system permease protein